MSSRTRSAAAWPSALRPGDGGIEGERMRRDHGAAERRLRGRVRRRALRGLAAGPRRGDGARVRPLGPADAGPDRADARGPPDLLRVTVQLRPRCTRELGAGARRREPVRRHVDARTGAPGRRSCDVHGRPGSRAHRGPDERRALRREAERAIHRPDAAAASATRGGKMSGSDRTARMSRHARVNLLEVENSVAGRAEGIDGRFGRGPVGARDIGVSLFRYAANLRSPVGHRHREQEEAYLVVGGSGQILLNDEVGELRLWDLVRVSPGVVRAFAAGPDGLEIVAVGGPKPEGGDGEAAPVTWPGG